MSSYYDYLKDFKRFGFNIMAVHFWHATTLVSQ